MIVTLPTKTSYAAKDQLKANQATKFIGVGSPSSSTEAYRKAYAEHNLANCGEYTSDDVVFISIEGNRTGRVKFDRNEVSAALSAGATLLTDTLQNRSRPYNVGERELAFFLRTRRYKEQPAGSGIWKPMKTGVITSLSMFI